MHIEFLILGKKTDQVTEEEWQRTTLRLKVIPSTTIQEIDDWAQKQDFDESAGLQLFRITDFI